MHETRRAWSRRLRWGLILTIFGLWLAVVLNDLDCHRFGGGPRVAPVAPDPALQWKPGLRATREAAPGGDAVEK